MTSSLRYCRGFQSNVCSDFGVYACKSWRALISDSHLVRKHLSRVVRGINANSYRLLISNSPLQSIDFEALKNVNTFVASRELHLQVPVVLDRRGIVGSCNGLICLKGINGDFFLWNPCTRDTLKLPGITNFPSSPMFYGFVCDSTVEDYKVVLDGSSRNANGLLTTTIMTFTLKTGSWRNVQDLNYVRLNGQGCLLNEALHWVESVWRPREVSCDLFWLVPFAEISDFVGELADHISKSCFLTRCLSCSTGGLGLGQD